MVRSLLEPELCTSFLQVLYKQHDLETMQQAFPLSCVTGDRIKSIIFKTPNKCAVLWANDSWLEVLKFEFNNKVI